MNFRRLQHYTLLVASVFLPLTALQKGDVVKGKKVFEQCAVCHNTDSDEQKVGPSLKGLFEHKKLKSGKTVVPSELDPSMPSRISKVRKELVVNVYSPKRKSG